MQEHVEAACQACGRGLERGRGYILGGQLRCTRCTMFRTRILRRSFLTALVIGTILLAINHGNNIVAGDVSTSLAWKVPLTYTVPFCVATWGALVNSRASSTTDG
jgi:hypothetical protein